MQVLLNRLSYRPSLVNRLAFRRLELLCARGGQKECGEQDAQKERPADAGGNEAHAAQESRLEMSANMQVLETNRPPMKRCRSPTGRLYLAYFYDQKHAQQQKGSS